MTARKTPAIAAPTTPTPETRRAEIAYGIDSLLRDLAADPAVAAVAKPELLDKPHVALMLAGMLMAYRFRAITLNADIVQLNKEEQRRGSAT